MKSMISRSLISLRVYAKRRNDIYIIQQLVLGQFVKKNDAKKKFFYPWIFAFYPALALLAKNISQVRLSDSLRSFFISLLASTILVSALRLLVRSWEKAAILSTVYFLSFMSYGHIYVLLRNYKLGSFLVGRHILLLPLLVMILAIWTWWITSKNKNLPTLTIIFNWAGLVLLIIPLGTLVCYGIQASVSTTTSQPVTVANVQFDGEPPDIYYIILDEYGRSDVLKTLYEYDNSEFYDALEQRGFYIAKESTSNYSSTLQSLSSSLNMDYINYLQDQYGKDANIREPFEILIAENLAFRTLRQSGYQLVAFKSGVFRTELRDADYFLKPTNETSSLSTALWSLNPFEGMLLESTALRTLFDMHLISKEGRNIFEKPYENHRTEILFSFSQLSTFAEKDGSYIVFVHIVSPHPPFVFGPNGEHINHSEPFSLSGLGRVEGGSEYVEMYTDQVHYLNKLLLDSVDQILERSTTPPIIIIQADHGPSGYATLEDVEKVNMKERLSIFNAYYFPGDNKEVLYPTITPVNTFRLIFDTYFGLNFDLLPDKNYFVPSSRPFNFIEVTDRVQTDPLVP